MGANADRRVIESAGQLLDRLTESLARLQGDLHGELPSVAGLWDRIAIGRYRPKDEEHLSDEITRHFLRDLPRMGLMIGRELQIRRGVPGGPPGQRTDLYVEAVIENRSGERETVAVIVEVKGSWNKDVLTAMGTQLADGYLAANPRCNHGLYVVGWYLCESWIEERGKQRTRRLGSKAQLQSTLQEEAGRLTTGTKTIRAFVLDTSFSPVED